MNNSIPVELQITYVGGPTALIELGGLRLLTDPTFDPAGTEYATNTYTLKKLADPGIKLDALGRIDTVLLSHDHHFDNLDHAGRAMLGRAGQVLTTEVGAKRLGGHSKGMAVWQTLDLPTASGRPLRVTSTPARHGPVDGDRGPVIGFLLGFADALDRCVYISGDTVWYEGVEQVALRFQVKIAMFFMGAATVRQVGPAHLTMTAEEGVLAARAFPDATIIPLHCHGWQHFTESRAEIQQAFEPAGIQKRLCWLPPGLRQTFQISS